jgi:hypothetical protein
MSLPGFYLTLAHSLCFNLLFLVSLNKQEKGTSRRESYTVGKCASIWWTLEAASFTIFQDESGSSVCTASDNWTTGVRSPTEAEDFPSSLSVQTDSVANPASCTMGMVVLFRGVKRGRGVMLTTHPVLVPRLRKSSTSCVPKRHPLRVAGPF